MNTAGAFYPTYLRSTDGVVFADLGFTSGASGAVPSSFPSGYIRVCNEIKSVTRTGTGAYTIALNSPAYAAMAQFVWYVLQASYSASGACNVVLVEDHSTNTTTPEVKILTTTAAGAAVDMSSGDVIGLTFGFVIKPSY